MFLAGAEEMLGGIRWLLPSLLVLEEFHLAQPFFRFFLGLIGSAKIFSPLGENLVSTGDFLDHAFAPLLVFRANKSILWRRTLRLHTISSPSVDGQCTREKSYLIPEA